MLVRFTDKQGKPVWVDPRRVYLVDTSVEEGHNTSMCFDVPCFTNSAEVVESPDEASLKLNEALFKMRLHP